MTTLFLIRTCKMLSNESIGKSLAASAIPIITILTVEHYYSILPFGGIWLGLYIISLLFTTIWIGWMSIQYVLKQNKPFTYNIEKNIYCKYANNFFVFLRNLHRNKVENDKNITTDDLMKEQKNIDDRIADFTKDIEKYFILRWYPKISDDETFLRETRGLLDDVMRRFLQIVVQIDNKKLVHGILIIFLKHIKEFRKTEKRQKNGSKSIEDAYRYAHVASKNDKAFEHFMCQITTKVFRQVLSWELYNSAPCKCLVSILARKLTTYVLMYVSSPPTINYKLAQMCVSYKSKISLNLQKYDTVNLSDIDFEVKKGENENSMSDVRISDKANLINSDGSTPNVTPKKSTAKKECPEREKLISRENEKVIEDIGRDEVDHNVKEKPLQVDSSRAVSAPVKIHNSQSHRTWRNSSDLECISLGEDLLALQDINDPDMQIQDLIDKKPWKENTDSLEVDEKQHPIWNITENTEELLETKELNIPSPNIPSFISNTIKPIGNVTATTLHNMKEFQQSTVNNVVKPVSQATSSAMHKIGDLQDEAAGVVEGILDFGMAGIRKGLRLTGLQDNLSDKTKSEFPKTSKPVEISTKPHKPARLTKIPHVASEDAKNVAPDDTIWMNPLLKDSPNFDGQILLEKSPMVPTISTEDTTSPDPEYEDATDLASTTAKLRSLLQQKTSESNLNTPAVSPYLPSDESNKPFSTPLEYAGRCASNSSSEDVEVDGALPSLYKFCARTATGVFQNTLNTIKTALPGNISDQEQQHRHDGSFDRSFDSENWMYVASDVGIEDFSSRTQRLLNERKAFCTVDNAYEAVESLDVLSQVDGGWNTPTTVYEDELDDLDIHIPFTKTSADIFCELVSETDTFLTQESVVKIILILFGEVSEEYICRRSDKLIRNINTLIGKIPNEPKKETLIVPLEKLADLCSEVFPSYVKRIVGVEVLMSAVQMFLKSFQSHKINRDVALQLFELFASLLIEASNKMTPAYSA